MNLEIIFISGLAAWRYGHLIVDDTIFENTKIKLLNKYENKVQNRKHQKIFAQKLQILFICIYCITFWTTLATFTPAKIINIFGATWAIATLVGVAHNKYLTEEDDQETDEETDLNKVE